MEISMKLKEIKNKLTHFFEDEKGNIQGEYKQYYSNSNNRLFIHCYYKDGKLQGEYKLYNIDSSLKYTKYYSNGKDVTDMYHKLKTWKSL